MKHHIKTVFMAIGIAAMVFISFFGWYSYETDYKVTFIERKERSEERRVGKECM